MRSMLCVVAALGIAGCASLFDPPAPDATALLPADAILQGEQHDAPAHQRAHERAVQTLAARGVLATVAIEMAEQGGSTAGLPRDANEEQVRAALRWNDQAWPWADYQAAVMAAVRAGVPVVGANLPRSQIAGAMEDASLDLLLPATALATQRDAIREGHCGLLPEAQVAPMARVQIARDRAMARTLVQARAQGKTVLLLAGKRHVDALLGVPLQLPAGFSARVLELPPQPQTTDHCAKLREHLQKQKR